MIAKREHDTKSQPIEMYSLPATWRWVTVADVGTVITGNTPLTKDIDNYGTDIAFVKPPELLDKGIRTARDGLSSKGMKNGRILPSGAVLVSCIGGLGKTGIAKVPVAFNQQINAIVFNESVLPEYGFYYVQTLKPWLYSVASATTLPIVNKGKFQLAPFPLAPFGDQKLIVAEIEKQFSRLDEAVAGLKRIKANLKRYKAAVLKAAVEGGLTEEWRNTHPNVETGAELLKRILAERKKKWEEKNPRKKYKEPVAPDASNLPELPEGWVWATVDALAFVTKLAGFEYTKYVKYVDSGDLAVIKAENAGKDGFKRTIFSKILSSTVAQLRRSRLLADDLLMVFVGAGTGNVARVPNDQAYFLGPNISMIRPQSSYVSTLYLELFLRSPFGNSLALGFTKAVAQPSLSMGTIRMIPIAMPPLVEQQAIVAIIESRLSISQQTETVVYANLKRAERLRQSILKKAFSGKL